MVRSRIHFPRPEYFRQIRQLELFPKWYQVYVFVPGERLAVDWQEYLDSQGSKAARYVRLCCRFGFEVETNFLVS